MLAEILILIAVILLAVLITLVVVASRQPEDFTITRSAVMAAPASRVFAQVNDFHRWEAWSPWARRDPAAKTRYEGEPAGTGATFHWDGPKTGAGSMTITDSQPPQLIRIRLDFLRPMACTNMAEFTFREDGMETHVTWSMSGKNTLLSRMMCLCINMDKMVGKDFEQGLAEIRKIVEAGEEAG